jgi:hypothetical protein
LRCIVVWWHWCAPHLAFRRLTRFRHQVNAESGLGLFGTSRSSLRSLVVMLIALALSLAV